MSVPAAYFAVVLIWSTTPLGITWSSETVNPTLAVLARMVIAVVLGWLILKVSKIELPLNRQAFKLYGYSTIGIFGGMSFAYVAAQYISSGLISLIFGLAPILSGILAQKILNEPKFSKTKKFALLFAMVGLAIVCYDKVFAQTGALSSDSYLGIAAVLCAVFFFSISGVLVKSVDIKINALASTVGSLVFSIPFFVAVWLVFDGTLPVDEWETKSLLAILYLGVFGSLIGFIAYYYVLQKLDASTVALITMITPVIAICFGALLNNETVTDNLIIGASFVMGGLALYQWGGRKRTKVTVPT
ncbi:DMT family transporter [Pseudocolwellia agarivorans]|uniref:DMT family transporter n=1 Tax=Pseudocolwellia agarivorans TaxID=1911682 RepID=UPI0009842FAA|nr:DMT family transporter [Pseudocolwellia agarivorans]